MNTKTRFLLHRSLERKSDWDKGADAYNYHRAALRAVKDRKNLEEDIKDVERRLQDLKEELTIALRDEAEVRTLARASAICARPSAVSRADRRKSVLCACLSYF